ncbi:MAG: type II toxin-antitoxin system Phd/YefM family antitoxin [Gallionellales bacterium CG_4_8_14_3_um_filter_54_18]|nr:MAG: type II toxin-antitoxin system Phd/YefM family antitoxin [Gallionellales bacterium CG_4_8_14_3_um_filter_54_18]
MYAFQSKSSTMPTFLTATRLRAELFSTLDHILDTGEAVEVKRPKGSVRIVRNPSTQRLASLKPHPGTINGNADDLANLSWEQEWKPSL